MSGAGDLREKVQFEQRAVDGNGDRLGAWNGAEDAVTVAAGLTYVRRGEAVNEGRLQGQMPVVIRVWSSPATRAVTTAWRAILLSDGTVLNLQTREPTLDRKYVEFLAIAYGSNE